MNGIDFNKIFVICLCIGVFFLLIEFSSNQVKESKEQSITSISTTNPIVQVSSLQELENAIGYKFDVYGIQKENESFSYINSEPIIAQINFYKGEDKICLRKSRQTDSETKDLSGDYRSGAESKIYISDVEVNIKISSNKVLCAYWKEDNYFYSLFSQNGLEEKEAKDYIEILIKNNSEGEKS